MAEEIKELIEKIQQEGVQAAESKAKQIEEQSRKEAEAVIEKAMHEAARITVEAKERSLKMEESTKALLKQAARDTLLALKKEINAMLERIVVAHVKDVLKPEELAGIITALLKDFAGKQQEITVSLKKEDLEKLEKQFLRELKEKTKQGITLKPSEDISGGFVISYDGGKSYYDFSDKAIAAYIVTNLKPKLEEILNGK